MKHKFVHFYTTQKGSPLFGFQSTGCHELVLFLLPHSPVCTTKMGEVTTGEGKTQSVIVLYLIKIHRQFKHGG